MRWRMGCFITGRGMFRLIAGTMGMRRIRVRRRGPCLRLAGATGRYRDAVGPAGATGAAGPQGPAGAQGAQGRGGATGAQGPAVVNLHGELCFDDELCFAGWGELWGVDLCFAWSMGTMGIRRGWRRIRGRCWRRRELLGLRGLPGLRVRLGLRGRLGRPGPQGAAGPPVTFLGGWLVGTSYGVGAGVSYGGSSYVALVANTGRAAGCESALLGCAGTGRGRGRCGFGWADGCDRVAGGSGSCGR